jgi:hypothetical protein
MPRARVQHIFKSAAAQVGSGVLQFWPESHCIAFFRGYGLLDEYVLSFRTSHLLLRIMVRYPIGRDLGRSSGGNLIWATLSTIDRASKTKTMLLLKLGSHLLAPPPFTTKLLRQSILLTKTTNDSEQSQGNCT